MIIDDLKILLDVDDAEMPVLNLYIRKAKTLITYYLNSSTEIDIEADCPDAVIEYATINYNKRGNEGLKDYKFENTSATYNDDGLPQSVKDLLPPPYVKMLGVYSCDTKV